MDRILTWDIPTRLFHWLFAGSFVGAFVIAEVAGDDSAAFPLHMLLGGVLALLVVLRVVWGLVGSRWARFGSFAFGPGAVLDYLRGALTGTAPRYAGHNPGTAWAVGAMLAIGLGLAVTGAMMGTGGEVFEELHELLAWSMVAVVVGHLAGLALHTVRHRENIGLSMVTGRKLGAPADAIPRAHAFAGLALLGLTGAWAYGLVDGYDAATGSVTLPVIGTTLQLGESEGGGGYDDEEDEDDDD